MAEVASDLVALLPDTVDGWEVSTGDRVFNRDNLYDYIDGGAELYLSFRFKRLLSRTYSNLGQPDMVVDLFDMEASQDAFGVFSLSTEVVDTTVGQGSQYTRGLLLFWKDKYFVSILASPETDESRRAVFKLARYIEAAVPAEGGLPGIVSLLPPQSLVRGSVRYFRHHVWQNSHHFISTENILHINGNTDACLAKYGDPAERYVLLLVQYGNADEAKLGYDDFAAYYLPELSEKAVVRVEDDTWVACQLTENLLAVVLNAPTEQAASHLLEVIQKDKLSD